jgi:hypothetical protein
LKIYSRWMRIDTLHTIEMFLCNRNGNKQKALKQNCIINTILIRNCIYGHRWFLDISTANVRQKKVHGLTNQQLVCVIEGIIVSLLPCLDETWWYRHRWLPKKGSFLDVLGWSLPPSAKDENLKRDHWLRRFWSTDAMSSDICHHLSVHVLPKSVGNYDRLSVYCCSSSS